MVGVGVAVGVVVVVGVAVGMNIRTIIFADSAWWYDERGGISVFIRKDGVILSCKIRRADLVRFIERGQPRKQK